MQDFKNSKIFVCGSLIFNIHIFRFKMDAGLQVAILTLILNLNFLVQGAVSFHSSVGTQNQPTIHLVGLEGPPNHPASKARGAFCVNVNKHGSY